LPGDEQNHEEKLYDADIQKHIYRGLNFTTLRLALLAIFWWKPDMEGDEWATANARYVIPQQHNWESPIDAGSNDTYIQYWINQDDRIIEDQIAGKKETVLKEADITVRFIGEQAEQWAKSMHHLAERETVAGIFLDFCNAELFEYVGPIVPMNIDYFKTKVGNAAIAFDVDMRIRYWEYMDLSDLRKPLEYIEFGEGEIISGNILAGG
jgi:hypothetical protein